MSVSVSLGARIDDDLRDAALEADLNLEAVRGAFLVARAFSR
jgi:hypothetical protein